MYVSEIILILALVTMFGFKPLSKFISTKFSLKSKSVAIGFVVFWLLLLVAKVIYKV